MKETLKKYSPKPENINLGWFNKHLTNPEIWKWNKKTISRAFAIGLFFAFIPLPMHTLTSCNLCGSFFCKYPTLNSCCLDQ